VYRVNKEFSRNGRSWVDWDRIMDGSTWNIVCGDDKDYPGTPGGLKVAIYTEAKKRGRRARIRSRGNTIQVTTFPREEEKDG